MEIGTWIHIVPGHGKKIGNMLQVRIYNVYFLTSSRNWKAGLPFYEWCSTVEIDNKIPSIFISQAPTLYSTKDFQQTEQNGVNNGNEIVDDFLLVKFEPCSEHLTKYLFNTPSAGTLLLFYSLGFINLIFSARVLIEIIIIYKLKMHSLWQVTLHFWVFIFSSIKSKSWMKIKFLNCLHI